MRQRLEEFEEELRMRIPSPRIPSSTPLTFYRKPAGCFKFGAVVHFNRECPELREKSDANKGQGDAKPRSPEPRGRKPRPANHYSVEGLHRLGQAADTRALPS